MTEIHPITEADIPDVLQMIRGIAAYHGDEALITAADLRRDAFGPNPWLRVLVAKGQGYVALIPLAQLQFGVRGIEIHHIFVKESARGRGVGRALINAAIEYAKGQEARYLSVGTHPDNLIAQDTYRAIGFDESPVAGPRFRMRW
ncbi:GNAT family N-acetyltransferase [Sulfitobacter donghicola]|uniref:Acetyltransferase n=1 Tax=Sulfitobacter donghicola DSW-25 = KCTC 12864 = JCM 14565 TaxID=1300350 RepID=A0A073IKN7_9RHOB|nr:GNAT family N-acetyltransferase [Sulfitobacter donghicola]KEJ90898.1 acetyltransferase [Sulfitobacter donghicola DSW-25 = KCTC 12864 = JCM 14565]